MDVFVALVLFGAIVFIVSSKVDWLAHEASIVKNSDFLPEQAKSLVRNWLLKQRVEQWQFAGASTYEDVQHLESLWGMLPDGAVAIRLWADHLHPHGVDYAKISVWRGFTPDLEIVLEWVSHRFYELKDARPWIVASPTFSVLEAVSWDSWQFSAEEAAVWRRQNFTPDEAAEWSEQGIVSAQAAHKWRSLGGKPGDVGSWLETSFRTELELAWAWHSVGAGPMDADLWGKDFHPTDADAWRAEGFSPDTPDRNPRKWKKAVGDPKSAGRWFDIGLTAESAEQWSQFCQPLVAYQWLQSGVTSAHQAEQFTRAGCSVQEASSWSKAGVLPEDIARWKKVGVNHDTVEKWRLHGFATPNEADGWATSGMDAPRAQQWRGITHDPAIAVAWWREGFTTAQAHVWLAAGASPATAAKWIAIGVDQPGRADRFGCSPDEVVQWRESGVTDDEIPGKRRFWTVDLYRQWIDVPGDELLRREWSLHGSPAEVRDLLDSGTPAELMTTWLRSDIPPRERSTWSRTANGDHALARDWWTTGAEPDVARDWILYGRVTPEAARSWIDARLAPADAGPWIEAGYLSYSHAEPWIAAEFSPSEAAHWSFLQNPEQAAEWKRRGFTPEDAREWFTAGFSPDQASEWIDLPTISPNIALRLHQSHVTPDETREWLATGIDAAEITVERQYWDSATFALWNPLAYSRPALRKWSMGKRFSFVKSLADEKIDETSAQLWLDGNLDEATALSWITEGFRDISDTTPWTERNFDPAAARLWREAGADPHLAQILRDASADTSYVIPTRQVAQDESTSLDKALWRASITMAGESRVSDYPVLEPQNGCCNEEELTEFLERTATNGATVVGVRHFAPYLTREMLEAVPGARLRRGSVKRFLFDIEDAKDGPYTVETHEFADTLTLIRIKSNRVQTQLYGRKTAP